jgi:hypothetical protein
LETGEEGRGDGVDCESSLGRTVISLLAGNVRRVRGRRCR